MEVQAQRPQNQVVRQLASLKVLSRLLGHELHSQSSTKTITLSREALIEIQTTVDLFIEEITRRQAIAGGPSTTPVQSSEPQLSGARN
jgi:hypothetical protein